MDQVFVPVIGFIALIAAVAVSVIVVRVASALIKRHVAPPLSAAPPDPEIGQLRDELDAMHERLDFLERALVARNNPSARALPANGERADATGQSP